MSAAAEETRWRRPLRRAVACLAAAGLLAACGGGTSDEEAMVDAISASILGDETFAAYEVTEAETTCVADSIVDGIGLERLEEIGFNQAGAEVDLAKLSGGELGVLARAMERCIGDIGAVLEDAVAANLLQHGSRDLQPTEEQAGCIAAHIVDEVPANRLITASVARQAGGENGLRPGDVDVYADAYTSCIEIREWLLAELSVSEPVRACLEAVITDADVHAVVVAALVGPDGETEAQQRLQPKVQACTDAR